MKKYNLTIKIQFAGSPVVPLSVIQDTFKIIASNVYGGQMNALFDLEDNFGNEISSEIFKTIENQLSLEASRSLNVRNFVTPGSCAYVADVGAVVYWLLANAQQQDPKEWAKTPFGGKVFSRLVHGLPKLADEIVKGLNARNRLPCSCELRANWHDRGSDLEILVTVTMPANFDAILTLDQIGGEHARQQEVYALQAKVREAQRQEALKGNGF